MPLAVPFDYRLTGSIETVGRRVRIYRGRHKISIREEDFHPFAIALWTLSRKPDADIDDLKKDRESLTVSGMEEVEYESRADIDMNAVFSMVGKARLLTLGEAFDGSVLGRWFVQESDLLEEEAQRGGTDNSGASPLRV